jgi:hypothetical protein
VIADPLDVLGTEEEVSAERDVTRILHHVSQQVAEHGVVQRVEIDVSLPDLSRPLFVALREGVEHVLEQLGGDLVMCLSPTIARGALISAPIFTGIAEKMVVDAMDSLANATRPSQVRSLRPIPA